MERLKEHSAPYRRLICCNLSPPRRYALRLLHVALISLRRAHHDHSALGVVDAAAAAVNRSLRIVRHSVEELGDRADLLRHKDSRGQLGSVQEMAEWAWERVRTVVYCSSFYINNKKFNFF